MLSLSFFLGLFQQLFFKFDENLKMVLNQFISVNMPQSSWKKKAPFLRFIVGFYAHLSIFWMYIEIFAEEGMVYSQVERFP